MHPGTLRPLKTMLGPTREHKLSKIMFFLSSCSWALCLPLWRTQNPPKDLPKAPQIPPRPSQDDPKTIPRRSKTLQDLPMTVPRASKDPQRLPREPPRPSQDTSRPSQDSPKTLSRPSQDVPQAFHSSFEAEGSAAVGVASKSAAPCLAGAGV